MKTKKQKFVKITFCSFDFNEIWRDCGKSQTECKPTEKGRNPTGANRTGSISGIPASNAPQIATEKNNVDKTQLKRKL